MDTKGIIFPHFQAFSYYHFRGDMFRSLKYHDRLMPANMELDISLRQLGEKKVKYVGCRKEKRK
jgi:hypothetical protein